jgi:two-component system, OmpR family, alkaline phosphatase synthesis response regulator PhoP
VPAPQTVLIVEDDEAIADPVVYALGRAGYRTLRAGDGGQGLRLFRQQRPDLVILDLMLPGADGYQVLKSIRKETKRVPVIILTARAEEHSKIRGFRLDADQYVTKPFGILELLERVAALLRRSAQDEQPPATLVMFGDVRVDLDSHRVERAGVAVTLTPKAFDLLLALIQRQGKVASRADLLREVWGYGSFIMTRTVDSHIAELRRKLDDPEEPRHIVTVWKVGYRFAE